MADERFRIAYHTVRTIELDVHRTDLATLRLDERVLTVRVAGSSELRLAVSMELREALQVSLLRFGPVGPDSVCRGGVPPVLDPYVLSRAPSDLRFRFVPARAPFRPSVGWGLCALFAMWAATLAADTVRVDLEPGALPRAALGAAAIFFLLASAFTGWQLARPSSTEVRVAA